MADLPNLSFDGADQRMIITAAASTLAGLFAEFIAFPLENAKTRLQMNGKEGVPKYGSLTACLKSTEVECRIK
jgi:hypothetical protein